MNQQENTPEDPRNAAAQDPAGQEPTQEATEAAPAQDEFVNQRANADFLDQLFGRFPKGMDALSGKGGQLIKPREVTFIFDGMAGAPGIFTDENGDYLDVELTVRTLSSSEEIEALSSIGTEIGAVPYALAKRSLYAVEGKPLRDEQRPLIWEALGSTGRQLVLMAFQNLGGGASEAAMGKYRSSFSIS
jgi:hypothetical protein